MQKKSVLPFLNFIVLLFFLLSAVLFSYFGFLVLNVCTAKLNRESFSKVVPYCILLHQLTQTSRSISHCWHSVSRNYIGLSIDCPKKKKK